MVQPLCSFNSKSVFLINNFRVSEVFLELRFWAITLTFHEDDNHVQELLEGQVAVPVLVSQREHGLHKQGVGLEAQCVGELRGRELTPQHLTGFPPGDTAQIAGVTLVYFQDLNQRMTSVARPHVTITSPSLSAFNNCGVSTSTMTAANSSPATGSP